MICHSLSAASETDVLWLDPGTVDPAGPNPGGRSSVSFHVGNMKLRRHTRNILLGLLSCCVIFHLWFQLSQESNDIIMGSIYVVSLLGLCLPLLQMHTVSHVSSYSISALNRDCSHSTHMSSLTIPLTPFTVMRLVKGLFPNSFYPSLLIFILFYSL